MENVRESLKLLVGVGVENWLPVVKEIPRQRKKWLTWAENELTLQSSKKTSYEQGQFNNKCQIANLFGEIRIWVEALSVSAVAMVTWLSLFVTNMLRDWFCKGRPSV